MVARIIDFGVIATLVVLLVVGVCVLVYSLMGWTFVHDKLRREQKQDEKEKRKYGRK